MRSARQHSEAVREGIRVVARPSSRKIYGIRNITGHERPEVYAGPLESRQNLSCARIGFTRFHPCDPQVLMGDQVNAPDGIGTQSEPGALVEANRFLDRIVDSVYWIPVGIG